MFCQPDRQWHVFLLLASPTLISIFYTTHPKLRGSDPISSNSSNSSHLQIQSVVTSCLPSYVESSLRESSSTFFFVIFPVAFLTFLGAITHRLAATTPHIHLVQQLQMCKNTFFLVARSTARIIGSVMSGDKFIITNKACSPCSLCIFWFILPRSKQIKDMDNHRQGKRMEKAPIKPTAPRVRVLQDSIKAENPKFMQRFKKKLGKNLNKND